LLGILAFLLFVGICAGPVIYAGFASRLARNLLKNRILTFSVVREVGCQLLAGRPDGARSHPLQKIHSLNTKTDIVIREAEEADVEDIRALFIAAYGNDYAFPEFFDDRFLKKQIFSDRCLMLVATDSDSGRILGTGSVVFDVGSFTDLVGEFGRLVVHPDGRGLGIGNRLMVERLGRVGQHLHVGLADNRVEHPFSQKISLHYDFFPAGYLPIHNGEPVALFARHFNDALALRRNHPHVAPSVHWLADHVLREAGMPGDYIIDEAATSYPAEDGFALEEMDPSEYVSLLRFERGRLRSRDIFGPVKLHFGFRELERRNTRYLLAKREGRCVGAIGYSQDTNIDRAVRISELIYLNEKPVRFLLSQLERLCAGEWGVDYIETDVSADAPRMQKTLLELGFLPIAYVPAGVFHYTERLDTVRMARYFVPVERSGISLVDAVKPIANGVIDRFNRQWIEPRLADELPRAPLFTGLNPEQTARVVNLFQRARFKDGEQIAREGERDGKAYIVISGRAEIVVGDRTAADFLEVGEFLGELSLLNHAPHSAGVRADGPVEAAVIEHESLESLLQVRRDIGYVIYRNLAKGLGKKLKRGSLAPDLS
jgi:GNAT superfamily N-acetyltransferase